MLLIGKNIKCRHLLFNLLGIQPFASPGKTNVEKLNDSFHSYHFYYFFIYWNNEKIKKLETLSVQTHTIHA